MSKDKIIEVAHKIYDILIDVNQYVISVEKTTNIDYKYCENKPKINGIEITGEISPKQLNLATVDELNEKENIANKITIIDETVNNNQYPSAKCVYERLSEKANLSLDNLDNTGLEKFEQKADISLSNLNSTGQSILDAKVNKSGDTMTGNLRFNVNKQYSDPIHIICPEIDWTTAPTRNTNTGIHFFDKNGKLGPYILVSQNTGSAQNYFSIGYNSTNDPNFVGFNIPKATSKATTISTASIYKPAVVVQNYVNGTSWYRVWSDGWIEQGGISNAGTITFLKSFSNTNYTLVKTGKCEGTNGDWYGGANYNAGYYSKSVNNFVCYSNGQVTNYNWYACGY